MAGQFDHIVAQAYDYELPAERIAQRPIDPPDAAKLLMVERGGGALGERTFRDLPALLRPRDLLVFNNSRVVPARFFGVNEKTGGRVEFLLLEEGREAGEWSCLARPLKRLRAGVEIDLGGDIRARVVERLEGDRLRVGFFRDGGAVRKEELFRQGTMPIPPYIRDGCGDEQDRTDYQSLFARIDGSVAAPTASLHFTPELIRGIEAVGCETATLTLHVGAASFLPLWKEREEGHDGVLHPPGEERFVPDRALLERLEEVRARGGRVIAVGTTVVRALESMATRDSELREPSIERTSLFITPGYRYRAVDAIVTNFHQPRTTHLLLVQAFLGRERLEAAYRFALANQFRFLSYGDGMLIL